MLHLFYAKHVFQPHTFTYSIFYNLEEKMWNSDIWIEFYFAYQYLHISTKHTISYLLTCEKWIMIYS